MRSRLRNTDCLFVISLLTGLLMMSVFLFTHPYLYDEAFYACIPYRLATGDRLIQHEWHLSQFSSLFTYLPVSIWLKLKGSADGIIFFLRCVYLFIHTTATIVIFRFFRMYDKWAIVAAMIFFTQTPYRILGVSYNSMLALFLLFLSMCILSIYKNNSIRLYILAGFCYGCCCICNPLLCFAFILYLIMCGLWPRRESLKKHFVRIIDRYTSIKEKSILKNQKNKKKQKEYFSNIENFNCFFHKKAIVYSFLGMVIIGIIAVIFFFSTGGTISLIFKNINNLLSSSEYTTLYSSFFAKVQKTFYFFNKISLNLPFLLPLLFLVMFFDENRNKNSHRVAYLISSILLAILYMFGVVYVKDLFASAFSLPFSIISTTCYILTNNKNKTLFYCMCFPCMIVAIFQYFASITLLSSLSIIFAVNNIAGVFFARDLFKEMIPDLKIKTKSIITENKKVLTFGRYLVCSGLCLSILFNVFICQYDQLPGKNAIKATTGPYSGLYMTEEQYSKYSKSIKDLDMIKEKTDENDAVLLSTYNTWMYLYIERPFAVYCTWYQDELKQEQLIAYYKENPDRIPKYIYIDSLDFNKNYNPDMIQNNINIANEMFEFKQKKLSDEILLTVENYKF